MNKGHKISYFYYKSVCINVILITSFFKLIFFSKNKLYHKFDSDNMVKYEFQSSTNMTSVRALIG